MKLFVRYLYFTLLMIFFTLTQFSGVAMNMLYEFDVTDIDGNPGTLEPYKGKVLLIVNTASRCGFTSQYEGLQSLYETYKGQGLVVLGFPSNDFLGQEPGSDEEIKEFCSLNYNVSFPMYSKITVKGKNIHPLYEYLTSKQTNPEFAGKITWNFNKFLINREGRIIGRYASKVKPQDARIVEAIEAALSE
jgi:glutathione peroxidase